jgi:hypothetical protein
MTHDNIMKTTAGVSNSDTHLVAISNIKITSACKISQCYSQLQIRINRLAAGSSGHAFVPFQVMPDGGEKSFK